MTDSSSSSTVHTNVPDVGSTRMDNVPVQVTTIQLNKENYLRWSAAITVGIAGRGRIAYVNGRKVEPVEGSIAWDTWYLEDNQILNSDESFSIEDVYARVEAEEQRKLVSNDRRGEEQSAFLSRASVGSSRSSRKCTQCKKLGYTIDFCWDLHPEKKNSKGRPSASKQRDSSVTGPSDRKGSFSAEQLRELRAYLSQADGGQTEKSNDVKGNQALAVSGTEGTSYVGKWIVDSGTTHHMTGNPKLFHDYKLSSGKKRVLDKDKEDISAEAHELGKKEEEVEKDVPPMVTEQEGTPSSLLHGRPELMGTTPWNLIERQAARTELVPEPHRLHWRLSRSRRKRHGEPWATAGKGSRLQFLGPSWASPKHKPTLDPSLHSIDPIVKHLEEGAKNHDQDCRRHEVVEKDNAQNSSLTKKGN
ncbi:hypothetical protein EJ110_NYTH26024 [Nymphaea thermarum]|nr:hypothetical protein EJ110_NYTH26024 [Nymphaea thermarum]